MIQCHKMLSAGFLYYSINTCEFISFFVLGFKWPKLMKKWQNTQCDLLILCRRNDTRKYLIEIRLIILIVFSAAFGMFGEYRLALRLT